jgi:hypothetical protein
MTTQSRPTALAGPIADHDAIGATVQLYIDGSVQGDAAKLQEAFHPDARMYGAGGGGGGALPRGAVG